MNAEKFIDTNILVYAASNDPADLRKKELARKVLVERGLGLSAQVIQEFYHAATRKNRLGVSHEAAMNVITRLDLFPILPITHELVKEAGNDSGKHMISYFDAAILVAARHLGCQVLYSEDLNAGQGYSGVTVVNPFA